MESGTKAIAILLLFFAVLLQACSDDSPAPTIDYHQLNSHAVANITATNATFSAKIITSGKEPILEHGFTWGKTRPFINRVGFEVKNLGGRSEARTFTATVDYPFERNKTYYVRPFVKTATTVVYGNMVSFSTNP
jgi:hypothetical protein